MPFGCINVSIRGRYDGNPGLKGAYEMPWDSGDDGTIYQVVINHEEQYSIWPEKREVPKGWKPIGKSGSKEECLEYIEEVWTDMRPLSLRSTVGEFFQQKIQRDADKKGR
jgi:MbtH protein